MSKDRISGNEAIDAALRLDGDPDNVRAYYDDWANHYDRDTDSVDYTAPLISARLLREVMADDDACLLDAGCGTGLAGTALQRLGFRCIDGFDLSDAMLARARETGAYRALEGGVDMMQANRRYPAAAYDAVLSVGVFTLGHVPPTALCVLLELLRADGVLLVSTRTHYYQQTDFQAQVNELLAAGKMQPLKRLMDAPYNKDGDAHYWVFRKSG